MVNEPTKNNLLKSILKALKKRLKIKHLLFLSILIAANTFAWYIYMEKISSDIDIKVKAWNVSFVLNNQNMTDYVNFVVDDIYPGMTPFQQALSITNDGEVDARLSYEIVSVTVLGTTFTTEDGTTTEEQLREIMSNNYPFTISITTNHELIGKSGGTATFFINVTWPYESYNNLGQSNDALDTYWGSQAYTFKQNNPTTPCVKIRVKLSAIQVEETPSVTPSPNPTPNPTETP